MMFEICRVFTANMFSRLTIEMLLGYLMFVFFLVQCSKKKKEQGSHTRGSKSQRMLLTSSMNAPQERPSSNPNVLKQEASDKPKKKPADASGKDELKSGSKVKSVDSGPGGKKSKINKASKRKSDRSTSSANKESKPMDGTQNGPTPDDGNGNSEKLAEFSVINADECDGMDDTIDNPETPAVHDRVLRVAATDMIFDPKLVAYKGNVDDEKDPKEVENLEKEMMAACEKHETKFKDVRKNDEKNPMSRLPKSVESERSTDKRTPVPADLRVKMRPDQCVLYETKDQQTEDDEVVDEDGNPMDPAP